MGIVPLSAFSWWPYKRLRYSQAEHKEQLATNVSNRLPQAYSYPGSSLNFLSCTLFGCRHVFDYLCHFYWYFVLVRFLTALIFLPDASLFLLPPLTSFSSLSQWALDMLGCKRVWIELICRKLDDLHLLEIPGMVCYIQVGSAPIQETIQHIPQFWAWTYTSVCICPNMETSFPMFVLLQILLCLMEETRKAFACPRVVGALWHVNIVAFEDWLKPAWAYVSPMKLFKILKGSTPPSLKLLV